MSSINVTYCIPHFTASMCQYSVFNNSENLGYVCSTSGNIVSCSLSCSSNTYFYDGTIAKILTCNTANDWDFTGEVNNQLPHCQGEHYAFIYLNNIPYFSTFSYYTSIISSNLYICVIGKKFDNC